MRARVFILGLLFAAADGLALTPITSLRMALPNGFIVKIPVEKGTLARGSYVPVVAFSTSAAQAAAQLAKDRQWIRIGTRGEGGIPHWVLVAVRSAKADPLAETFDSMLDIFEAAKACDNERGAFVHLYLLVWSLNDQVYVKVEYSTFEFKSAPEAAKD